MMRSFGFTLSSLLYSAILYAAFPASASTTTLTFTGSSPICQAGKDDSNTVFTGCGPIDNAHLSQRYGDIPSQVDLTYRNGVGSTLLLWHTGYADLTDSVWSQGGRSPATDGAGANDSNSFAQITLTALPGYNVTLLGFDLGAFKCCDSALSSRDTNLRVYEVGDVPGSFSLESISTTLADHFSYSTPSAKGWVIEWENSAFNVGLDNLQFSVSSVPEPETYAMLVYGLALIGWRIRKQRIQHTQ